MRHLIAAFASVVVASAQTYYWDLNGSTAGAGATPNGTWDTSTANWNTQSNGTTSTEVFVSGKAAVFSAGSDAVNSYTVTVSGTQNTSGITIQDGTPTFTGGTINFGSGSSIFSVGTGLTASVDSVITGTGGLNKSGAGLLILDGSGNTYTGTTTVSAGTLRVNTDSNNMIPDSSAVAVAAGATFELNWGVNETIGGLSGAGDVNIRGNTLTIGGSSSSTFSGVISDSGAYGSLVKQGSGTLTLSGASTYAGPTTINAGAILVTNSSALGAATFGNTVASGATLQLQGGVTVSEGSFTVTGIGTGFGNGALRNVSGNNTLDSAVNLGGNTTFTSANNTLTVTGQLNLGSGHTLTVNGAGNTTLSGSITNSGNILQSGSGTTTLSGTDANSFGGTLSISNGTVVFDKTAGTNAFSGSALNVGDGIGAASTAVLRLAASDQIADYAGTLTIKSDGLFALNNQTEKINVIAGTGKIDLGTSASLTVGVNGGSSSFGGTIAGTGTLIKAGSGTLALQSALVLAGDLELNSGTLALSGYNLSVATLHITGNSTIDFAGGNSTLSATNFIVDAGVQLTIQNWTNAADFFYTQNWSGATFDLRGVQPMNQVVFNGFTAANTEWQGYDKQVTPVPEPSTYGAILIAALVAFAAWRRRPRQAATPPPTLSIRVAKN